ncbi:copper chaperone CopZ [Candidatus Galacturonibacter soehngenii]|uniref:Copper chaperone CopZ n=1 Tax=Candidatus Galacturonatibacter soehngenii TaxID=2307010 RepID=A0A7V7UAT6_9FIRM|nr:copper chaperone CopZ [Candidatus Galacturonibacter soehngenii]KAB1436567.1 copper chaperone CopZ [Candidatus Galacturonibacter soehngenii]MBA4689062.1 copper chaperone CopZ [Candidatus Galacturonibacter soehngenii]
MEKSIINVEGMSCEHCVKAIKNAVGALSGVADVSVDLGAKTVAVEYDSSKSTLEQIKLEIEDQGYDII